MSVSITARGMRNAYAQRDIPRSQAGLPSKLVNSYSWFLVQEIPSAYLLGYTVLQENSGISKIRDLVSEALSQTLNLVDFSTFSALQVYQNFIHCTIGSHI